MNVIKKLTKNIFGQKIIGFLIFVITKFIFHSIRWNCLSKKNQDIIFKKKQPYIFCCWHNRLFQGPYLLPKHYKINALQSSHSDGMMTAIIFKLMKINIIFGSSKKDGSKAFFKMVKSIQKGESIAITPDGPKGPKQKVKDGLIKLSQVTGAPIIPLVWYTKKNKKINSWDNFIIPYPFSKGAYLFGKPMYINRKLNLNEFKQARQKVEDELNNLTDFIERYTL